MISSPCYLAPCTPAPCNHEKSKLSSRQPCSFVRFFQCSLPWSHAEAGKVGVANASLESNVQKDLDDGRGSVGLGAENTSLPIEQFSRKQNECVNVGRMRVEELRIGEIYKGKISMVESYGIFVDIGTHTDGFIHISRLGISSLKQGLENALRVGEVVTVQIIDIDPVTDSISLVLADENALYQTVDLQPIMLPEREILKRVTIRRAKKAPQLLVPSRRRIMTLEARQRLKTHKRAVMAEQQAFQLHLARLKTGISQNTQSITAMDDSG